ncbi:T9SS type A sorting domain-containing protein [Gracilimonas mengyeensis]|uniref:Por secretion system C-terminal sorting domain-containing protein n=1 Tax=Gracilimonas mengyeensis TaxID=1302730 RepID=A0A521B9K9_9BACT|nr:T9SS type A sorting domain-containing protein [Gracilimonas mengyeensis]SMO43753.1 Por secretion system C-terminal sorting domain-containing protein [Gracilimonas mengyeensis]
MKKATLLIAALLLVPVLAMAQTTVTVSSNITTDTEWTADNEYLLDGMIFVTNEADLYIEAGTTVRGAQGQDLDASGLVITRGSRIFAEGTADNPIIFTAEDDEGLTKDDVGEWGGVILLGRASTNNTVEATIEGVNEITDDPALVGYGGDNDMDDSGVLRYVSIRHTGINIGSSSGNEIQGLTLGGVGAGTTIEYVESFASGDDGYEWFGGTVNTKYLISAFNNDDAFDWDQGFRGKGQFWFVIQDEDQAGRSAEMDGAGGDETGTPFAYPVISNATYIGPGVTSTPSGDPGQMLQFRDNTGALYTNSIFTDHPGEAVNVEDVDGTDAFDSRARLEADSLNISNSVFFAFGTGSTIADIANADYTAGMLSANNNEITDPEINGVSRTDDGGLDPRPGNSAVLSGAQIPNDPFFSQVSYKGAFGGKNWAAGWTALEEYGYLSAADAPGMVTVSENITEDTYWTADNEYLLDGMIFVTEGADLYIEAGTTVRGGEGQDLDATGLVVTRGSRLFAEGSPSNPIIFTAENDEGLTKDDVGEWGGVILLGRASTNNTVEATIEGVNEITDDPALVGYGGNDDMDDSGVLRYVSIRHTGINIGSSSGNEIQGLTLGGVGAGTTIEYIESFASGDDGYEWFGGTVNTRYLVSAFNNDDAFDWDQGFRGKGQFWFVIQDSDQAGRSAEMDGAGGDETGTPFAYPVISNATYIGPGVSATPSGDPGQMLQFRDNTGAWYTNSLFMDHPGEAVNVEDVDGTDAFDSRARLEADSLNISNSIFFEFGTGNTIADIANADYTADMLSANNNTITDPGLRGVSRTNDGGLDPRPNPNSAVYGVAQSTGDSWFHSVNYAGAFDGSNWLAGWTALDEYGFLGDGLVTDVEEKESSLPTSIKLNQNYPNPFNPTTQISFSLPKTQQVSLKVYDLLGREVATLAERQTFSAGMNSLNFDASSLSSGIYIYRLVSADVTLTKKMTLIK